MHKKFHIGFICHEYPPCNHGGIGSFTKDLAEALVQKGYQVTVIGFYIESVLKLHEDVDEIINGVRILRFPQRRKFSFIPFNVLYYRWRLYSQIDKLNSKNKFDVIESPGGSGWLPLGIPQKIPLVTRLHGGKVFTAFQLGKQISKFMKVLEKKQLQKSDHIISVSYYIAKSISKILKINKKYEVIYNSVNHKLFQYNEQVSSIEKNLIVFTGTIKKAKGVEELIQAMNIVCKENKRAHLILAGNISTLNYEQSLRKLLDDQFQKNVVFSGVLDREIAMKKLLEKSEVCCYPSYFESFGLAPLEAMALKKAVIFTKEGAGKEVIEDGISGLLCDPKDPQDIANKILLLLEDEILRNRLAENGRKRVLEKFTFEKWIETNIKMYEKIIG